MIENMRIEMELQGEWMDITGSVAPESIAFEDIALNSQRMSSVSTLRFSLLPEKRIIDAIRISTEKIRVRAFSNLEIFFFGEMEPGVALSWETPDYLDSVDVEAVDFSVKLDEKLHQSASYPAVVDGPAFWIYRKDNPDMSLLVRILELAGLSDAIAPDTPDIDQKIRHMAWKADDVTAREIIDPLLADYGWALRVTGDQIRWIRTAEGSGFHDDIMPEDLLGPVGVTRKYSTATGVEVRWPSLKVMQDMRLWQGRLPIGDTSDPLPGEPIAGGRYWPGDSDIMDIWQDFSTEWLDTEWAEGKSRLKNKELSLVASSDWRIVDKKDDSISLDPYRGAGTAPVIYEPLRALLRYKNNAEGFGKLYWSEIRGKALVKYHMVTTSLSEGISIPEIYETTYIYDKESAERLARIRDSFLKKGNMIISFSSCRKLEVGGIYMLRQYPGYEGLIQITSASVSGEEAASYSALSFDYFDEAGTVHSSASQGGGPNPPAEDAASYRYAYKRDFNEPAAPVGQQPSGWTFDTIPDGTKPVWMSCCLFKANGEQKGLWTRPVRVSGADAGTYRGALAVAPPDPIDGDFFLYKGTDTASFQYGHVYKYIALDNAWAETVDSDKIIAVQMDALRIAEESDAVVFAAVIYSALLVAKKLIVGGGTEETGLLVRFMDKGPDGKALIEIRKDNQKLFWLDTDTGKLYANFAEVIQYLPFNFNDSLDPEHPAVFSFYVPEGQVEYAKLRIKAQHYRTYSSVAASWGSSTTSTDGPTEGWDYSISLVENGDRSRYTEDGGAHSHSYTVPDATDSTSAGGTVWSETLTASGRTGSETITASGSTEDAAGPGTHSHDYSFSGSHSHSFSVSGSHSHSFSGASHSHYLTGSEQRETPKAGIHNHLVMIPTYKIETSGSLNHSHTINLTHSHSLELGIKESSEKASGMTISVDDGLGYSSAVAIASEQEATLNLTPGGWKDLKITSQTLGRVQVQLILKMRIDTYTTI